MNQPFFLCNSNQNTRFYDKNNDKKKNKCKDPCNEKLLLNRCCMRGSIGLTGPQGEPGGAFNYADFYALMPPDNAAALTITPLAGGTESVSAHLVITQLQ